MTDERSPWASPGTEVVVPGVTGAPQTDQAAAPAGTVLAGAAARTATGAGSPAPAAVGRFGAGTVTGGGRTGATRLPGTAVLGDRPQAPPVDQAARNRRILRLCMGAAAGIVAVGLVVIAVMAMTGTPGGSGIFDPRLAGPADTRPDLAKSCPPPSDAPDREHPAIPPAPPGPRTVDEDAGISYAAYGAPWETWDQVWSGGTLHVTYRVGQHFVTEPGPHGEGYHASILSGSVPATVNDSMVLDLECTGRLVAADVRTQYYYQPNTMDMMRDEQTTVGGLPAWVTKFRLHFSAPGLKAKDELVAVVLLDVGRPEAAILYVSIPGTHHEWDRIVDEVIDSVRPT